MTDAELDALEVLAIEATPGPWQRVTPYGIGIESGNGPVPFKVAWGAQENDAAFIAAANPATVTALIHEMRTCRANLLEEIDRLRRCIHYLAQKLVHDDGSGNSGLTSGKWKGAEYGECYTLYQTRVAAIQSWIEEAERETRDERNR